MSTSVNLDIMLLTIWLNVIRQQLRKWLVFRRGCGVVWATVCYRYISYGYVCKIFYISPLYYFSFLFGFLFTIFFNFIIGTTVSDPKTKITANHTHYMVQELQKSHYHSHYLLTLANKYYSVWKINHCTINHQFSLRHESTFESTRKC